MTVNRPINVSKLDYRWGDKASNKKPALEDLASKTDCLIKYLQGVAAMPTLCILWRGLCRLKGSNHDFIILAV